MRGVGRGVGRRYLFLPQRAAFGGVRDWGGVGKWDRVTCQNIGIFQFTSRLMSPIPTSGYCSYSHIVAFEG